MRALAVRAKLSPETVWILLLGASLAGLVTVVMYYILPPESDWMWVYRPATLHLLSGRSPYDGTFLNPPWVLVPLIPLALLPLQLGRALFFTLSLACLTFTGIRLRATPLSLAALLLSYPVVYGLLYGQLDFLLSLGFILPPAVGLFFVLAKPQIGIAVAIYWAVEAYREGGYKKLLKTFLPITSAFALAYLLFRDVLLDSALQISQNASWNTSLSPWSIPIGLILLVLSIWQKNLHPSVSASPLLSPYVAMHSWMHVLLGASSNALITLLLSALLWGIFLSGHGPAGR